MSRVVAPGVVDRLHGGCASYGHPSLGAFGVDTKSAGQTPGDQRGRAGTRGFEPENRNVVADLAGHATRVYQTHLSAPRASTFLGEKSPWQSWGAASSARSWRTANAVRRTDRDGRSPPGGKSELRPATRRPRSHSMIDGNSGVGAGRPSIADSRSVRPSHVVLDSSASSRVVPGRTSSMTVQVPASLIMASCNTGAMPRSARVTATCA